MNYIKYFAEAVLILSAELSMSQSPGGICTVNLQACFKADLSSGATNTGDPITQWNDNSPFVAHAAAYIFEKSPASPSVKR